MITTTTAPFISVIYDICSGKSHQAVVVVIIRWCDLQLHMSYISEIQEAVVVVIIWWCDLPLHMSYITEIQGAVITPSYYHDHDGPLYFSNISHM
jgi:hypothetical protein